MIINFQNDSQLGVTFSNQAEQVLLNNGYDKMSTDDKNSLLVIIANKENMVMNEITSDYILSYHKKLKCAAIDEACNSSITSGFTSSNGHTYTLDMIDQVNFLAQKDELRDDSTITTVDWKAEDVGDWISHTKDEWLQKVYGEGFTFVKNQRTKAKGLKLQINQATDHPTIVGLNWS